MRIVLTKNGAKAPIRATEGSAGYDLFVPEDTYVHPGRNVIPLGFKVELPDHVMALSTSRSGFASKGMEDADEMREDADVIDGKIDWDYRGEVGVIIKSAESYPFLLKKGTRIAQFVLLPVLTPDIEVVEELSETDRGEGGFGHSGV